MIVRFSKSAKKYYDILPNHYRNIITDAIKGLKEKPPIGDIKHLKGRNDDTMRLRVGKYRIIFKFLIEGIVKILFIQDIGPRGDIYK